MRISDWSSDVCSSDLRQRRCRPPAPADGWRPAAGEVWAAQAEPKAARTLRRPPQGSATADPAVSGYAGLPLRKRLGSRIGPLALRAPIAQPLKRNHLARTSARTINPPPPATQRPGKIKAHGLHAPGSNKT